MTQCHIPELHTLCHSVTSQNYTTNGRVSHPRATQLMTQCHIPELQTNDTMSHPRTTQLMTQCHIPELHTCHSVTSQNYTTNGRVSHPRTTQLMTQCHIPELHNWWHSVTSQNYTTNNIGSHPNTLEPSQYIPGNLKVAIDVYKNKKHTFFVLYVSCKHFNLLCIYTIDVSDMADNYRYGPYDSLVWWNNFSGRDSPAGGFLEDAT